MKGYCLTGDRIYKNGPKTEYQPVIITKLKHNAVYTLLPEIPFEYHWKLKAIKKLCKTETDCIKLMTRLLNSEFIKLFDNLEIKEIELEPANLKLRSINE